MQVSVIILLCVIIAILSALLVILLRSRKESASATEEPVPDVFEELDTSGSIYRYVPASGYRFCPCCDGENARSARSCKICGQRF